LIVKIPLNSAAAARLSELMHLRGASLGESYGLTYGDGRADGFNGIVLLTPKGVETFGAVLEVLAAQ
jgi:hypothetical protein